MRAPTLRGISRSSPHGGAVLAFCPRRIDENAPQPDKNAKKTLHTHIHYLTERTLGAMPPGFDLHASHRKYFQWRRRL
jgi:hypothetical protein